MHITPRPDPTQRASGMRNHGEHGGLPRALALAQARGRNVQHYANGRTGTQAHVNPQAGMPHYFGVAEYCIRRKRLWQGGVNAALVRLVRQSCPVDRAYACCAALLSHASPPNDTVKASGDRRCRCR